LSTIDHGLFIGGEKFAVPFFKKLVNTSSNETLKIIHNGKLLYSCPMQNIICLDFAALWKTALKKAIKILKELEGGGFEFQPILDENNKEIFQTFCGCPFCYAKRFNFFFLLIFFFKKIIVIFIL
jgi:hypothetical protein